jgi:hypothetical protein
LAGLNVSIGRPAILITNEWRIYGKILSLAICMDRALTRWKFLPRISGSGMLSQAVDEEVLKYLESCGLLAPKVRE